MVLRKYVYTSKGAAVRVIEKVQETMGMVKCFLGCIKDKNLITKIF